MKQLIHSLVILMGLSISSLPVFAQVEEPFHSYANLSDTDKLSLVTQELDRAIRERCLDRVIECLSQQWQHSPVMIDSVTGRFQTLFARLDSINGSPQGSAASGEALSEYPAFHIIEERPLRIAPDTAALEHNIYLGDDPTSYDDQAVLCFNNWLGMYGVTNLFTLADKMDGILDGALLNPLALKSQKGTIASGELSGASSIIPRMLKHKAFHPGGDGHGQCEVLTRTYAKNEFGGNSLFSHPYDVSEATVNVLGVNHWALLDTDANWD